MQDPTAWANKRKAAIENAKKLREQRKNAVDNPEECTFAPQLNKRPSYLSNKDSDALDRLVQRDSNDIFEQPLPGNKASYGARLDGGSDRNPVPPQLSPSSDALGREIKKFPAAVNQQSSPQKLTDSQYKSQFLQQYETDKARKIQASQAQQQKRQQETETYQPTTVDSVALGPDEDPFFSSLRGGSNDRSNGPGWNNDIGAGGGLFGAPPPLKGQSTKNKRPARTSSFNENNSNNNNGRNTGAAVSSRHNDMDFGSPHGNSAYASPDINNSGGGSRPNRSELPPRRNRNQQQNVLDYNSPSSQVGRIDTFNQPPTLPYHAQQQQQQQQQQVQGRSGRKPDWNNDTEVNYGTAPTGPAAPQPFATASDGAASLARPSLSLLKSKMRRSESGGSVRSGNRSNSSSASNLFAAADGGGRVVAAGAAGAGDGAYGRHSAPNNSNARKGYQQNEMEEANYYDPSIGQQQQQQQQPPPNRIAVGGRHKSHQHQQQQQNSEEADSYYAQRGTSQYQQQYQQQQYQQPYQQPYQQQQQQPPQQRQRPSQVQQQYQDAQYYDEQEQSYTHQQQRTGGGGGGGGASEGYSVPSDAIPGPEEGLNQHQCPDCGRMFNPIPFEKHIKICAKVFKQKRKAFDSTKMRVKDDPELARAALKAKKEEKRAQKLGESTKAAAAAGSATNRPINGSAAGGQQKWKSQSEAFRQAMRAARETSQAIASGAPLPPPVASAPDPSLVPCPHCGRTFNQKAADRHIPQCQNIKAKPTALKRGAGGGGGINGKATTTGKSSRGFMR